MLRQFCFVFFTALSVLSCNLPGGKKQEYSKLLPGHWLILYPDHELTNPNQRKIYAEIQDSIVSLFGLKTISIHDDGSFVQTDSILHTPGRWHYSNESKDFFIRNAGKGLEFFKGNLVGINNDTMRVVEMISAGGEQIKLTWYLKRIDDKQRIPLFKKEDNWWRKSNVPENPSQLKKKVKVMLDYYARYYEMISNESAYFVQSRVFLPLSYYQHSMGLKSFNENSQFSHLFYDISQAREAHNILSAAMDKISDQRFPSGKDFVIEYAMYLKRLADAI